MEIFSEIFGGLAENAAKIITAIGEAIDKNVTSDEERMQLQLEFKKLEGEMLLESHARDAMLVQISDAIENYTRKVPSKKALFQSLSHELAMR